MTYPQLSLSDRPSGQIFDAVEDLVNNMHYI